MHLNKKLVFILLTIVLTIIFSLPLYFANIKFSPPGFYIDEALPAYSALSIIETQKDEYGMKFPLVFRFYGSYNPPIFIYVTALAFKYINVSIEVIRGISGISSILTGIVIIFLVRALKISRSYYLIAILTMLFVSTPWLVFYGRIGYEVVIALLLLSSGITFAVLSINKPLLLLPGFLLISLSTYAAYAERFIAPMFIFGFLILFWKKYIKYKKILFISLLVALLTQIPNLYLMTTPAFFPKQNLFYNNSVIDQANKLPFIIPYFTRVILAISREFISQYLEYFSPRSLFFVADPDPQRSFPELSVFYPWMAIPYVVGIYHLFNNYHKTRSKIILLLLIISPIPAALTHDPFSTHRALPHLIPLFLVISLGLNKIFLYKKIIFKLSFPLVFILSLLMLWRSMFILLPNERAKYWGVGLKELSEIIKSNPNNNFIIDESRMKPTYANLAFFLQYPPEKFQKEIDQNIKENYYNQLKFNSHIKFANIETRSINWEEDPLKSLILVGDQYAISDSQAKEHNLTKFFEIKNNNEIILVGYKTNY